MWVCPDRIRAKPAAPPTIAAIARKAYGGAIPAGVDARAYVYNCIARFISYQRGTY